MEAPINIPFFPSAQVTVAGTTTGAGIKQLQAASFLTVVCDISAIGVLTQAADTLDVYIDASHDKGVTWFNIGRFLRITGVDSVSATGVLTSTGAITSGVHAQSTLTSDATAPSDGETVTLGSTVYTFKTTLSVGPAVAFEVLIGGSAAAALGNLKKAINLSGVAGTDYGTGTTVHPTVVGFTLTGTTLLCVARVPGTAANTIATTETSAHLSFTGATLNAGTTGVAGETVTIDVKTYMFVTALSETAGATAIVNQVLYGGSVTQAFANLKAAINAAAGAGTTYSTGTTINAGASSSASDATTVSLTAVTIGTPGNSVVTTETMANGAFGAATLTGGTYGAGVVARQSLTWTPSILESSQPVNIENDISSSSGGIRQVGFGDMLRYRSVVTGAEPDFTFSVIGVLK